MHLAYLDDSQDQTQSEIAIFGAIIIPNGEFGWAERMHSIAIEKLFSPDEVDDKFKEFHGCELYNGEGVFKGMDQESRFNAIRVLLDALRSHNLSFVYGAIDEKKLAKHRLSQGLLGTAHPLSPAFKLCCLGIERWAQQQVKKFYQGSGVEALVQLDHREEYLLIADETNNQELKKQLRKDYRLLRAACPYTGKLPSRLHHAHDAMYFGHSRESVGIQLADLCTYFMRRHLQKRNFPKKDEADEFYRMLEPYSICAKPEPEWTEYRELLLSHSSTTCR